MSEPRWEFFTRIAEMCDTARRHSKDFITTLPPDTAVAILQGCSMLNYHLRQAENQARTLAGPRPQIAYCQNCSRVSVEKQGTVCDACRELLAGNTTPST